MLLAVLVYCVHALKYAQSLKASKVSPVKMTQSQTDVVQPYSITLLASNLLGLPDLPPQLRVLRLSCPWSLSRAPEGDIGENA